MGMCLYVATVSTLNLHKDINKYIRKGSYYKLYDLMYMYIILVIKRYSTGTFRPGYIQTNNVPQFSYI